MVRRLTVRVLICAAAVTTFASSAQGQLPQKPENLQVLPKDMPTDSVVAIMRGVALALGVRCNFCHVERQPATSAPPATGPGGGGPFANFDFKSDEKDHKKTARAMFAMVDTINTRLLPHIPNRDDPPTNVRCITCHRGLTKPTTIEAVLLNTTTRGGVDSAIARYRMLRNDIALGKYDFGEQPVSDVAQRLVMQKRFDDAIKLLQMNQEFYPNSMNIDFQLADAYVAKGDTAQAVTRLRSVLTKNPNDRRAQGRLRQLGVQP
jgi:hypothetical protein